MVDRRLKPPLASAPPAPPDLRQRILLTSEQLLEEQGVAALSLREVARRAGVTHQAPYHHFADREAILAELVTQGFDELSRRLAQANDRVAVAGRREALIASGQAYVGFALEHPGVFRIMFRPDVCDPARFPGVQAAGERAHAELRRLVQLLHEGQAVEVWANLHWSQVHGLACLLVDGPLGQERGSLRERRACMTQTLKQFAELLASAPAPRRGARL
ncbi:TetR/AcrR family transcriptional regulator [Rhizobacter sp. AJA081-3]|uniref:TetR/AcrR family transcriptional regulator n=1 Tax=Rhizobacter sp. AJA081-3 TaxID=2753607 RepID=UPI001ADF881F|nr:TetR/AcrR family transcriptional regulator [Rhizobacter sp. AJA081-3]QTN24051.1 TetR/AcrR family transcriptional regulator [Rhizobacter sp. AJA081-3]